MDRSYPPPVMSPRGYLPSPHLISKLPIPLAINTILKGLSRRKGNGGLFYRSRMIIFSASISSFMSRLSLSCFSTSLTEYSTVV